MSRTITEHIVEGDIPQNQLTIEAIDSPGAGGASHRYDITGIDSHNPSSSRSGAERQITILFQNGPIQEHGVNGITQEVLLAIVIDRLRSFQEGPYPCEANAQALAGCEMALHCLKERTRDRLSRGVEGKTEA